MKRCISIFVLALSGLAGCATTKPAATGPAYSADVSYTISAATLAELAQAGQDYRLALSVQSGAGGEARSCTVAPSLPTPKPLAQRLVISR
jgi:hypothetical protein